MEGLIPLVFRKVKRTETRRQYECLPSGVVDQSFNVDDLYINAQSHVYITPPSSKEKIGGFHAERNGNRRRNSMNGEYSGGGYFTAEDMVKGHAISPPHYKPKMSRSYSMFSCLTGA